MNSINSINGLTAFFKTTSDVVTAGLAVTTFSLFLYSLTFKIRDRLTNIFSVILLLLILVFGADAFGSVITDENVLLSILKVHWIGLIFIPTLYFIFSDALLAMTGKPSMGKRKIIGIFMLFISAGLSVLLLRNELLGDLVMNQAPAPFFRRTFAMNLYLAFFFISIAFSVYNFFRAIKRTNSPTSKRRMIYLVGSALGLLSGLFPYFVFEESIRFFSSVTFWFVSTILYMGSWTFIIGMTYAISFFGFSIPDREIKKRILHWFFRGPLTASLTLGITTLIRRTGVMLGKDLAILEILAMVAAIVLFEHLYTLFFPKLERILFRGKDLEELKRIHSLEERLFTKNDFNQFAEIILANLCDRLRAISAVLFLKPNGELETVIKLGDVSEIIAKAAKIEEVLDQKAGDKLFIHTNGLVLLPIKNHDDTESAKRNLGFIVLDHIHEPKGDAEQNRAIQLMLLRLRTAIIDYQQQQKILTSLDVLTPQMDEMQNLLAAGRFVDMNAEINLENEDLLNKWTKDALSHLWGGPKLSSNVLLQLNIVQKKADENGDTLTKTLRAILQSAINSLKPQGERQYTNDWLLYNILDFKFNENMKMRDIAKRLSLSEADLYRKQRIAIASVTKKLVEMESVYLQGLQ
ncbi:MAG: hypothetical protein GYA52_03480 [Chloroflexi bacterium]|nr:hypothetical protein [Chloroflexota bacterium]